VRWDNLLAHQETCETAVLPLFPGEAVVRRFNTPQFRGMTFYEVAAKSIVNHVPGERFGFNWTINPYRGCSHACAYCLPGDTAILLADGSVKALGDVTEGDALVGTRVGACGKDAASAEGQVGEVGRRFCRTIVLKHWRTVKAAFRVLLADGTRLVASGEHRFLTVGGWRGVAGRTRPGWQTISVGDRLLGFGGPRQRTTPPKDADYQRGYLVGAVKARVHEGPSGVINLEAIRGACPLEGELVRSEPGLGVVAVEPLRRDLAMYDITTTSGDFIAEGVVSHNCFARPTHTYLDFDAGRDFESKIVVKINAPALVRRELRRPTWNGELIAMGTNTDPYQRAEGHYRLMRGILTELNAARNPYSILTKGTLIQRDLDLLTEGAAVTGVAANFSVGTVDEAVWRRVEPGTPHPMKRLEVVRKLNDAGIPCGVLMAPILPGISDAPEQMAATVKAAAEAGATHITPITLHLRPGVKEEFMDWLAREFPELVPAYQANYRRTYARKEIGEEIGRQVGELRHRYGVTGTRSSGGRGEAEPASPGRRQHRRGPRGPTTGRTNDLAGGRAPPDPRLAATGGGAGPPATLSTGAGGATAGPLPAGVDGPLPAGVDGPLPAGVDGPLPAGDGPGQLSFDLGAAGPRRAPARLRTRH
jgi:DNA repair photolyase